MFVLQPEIIKMIIVCPTHLDSMLSNEKLGFYICNNCYNFIYIREFITKFSLDYGEYHIDFMLNKVSIYQILSFKQIVKDIEVDPNQFTIDKDGNISGVYHLLNRLLKLKSFT